MPDLDEASLRWVDSFRARLDNCFVVPVEVDDTHPDFVKQLQLPLIPASDYITERMKILNYTDMRSSR